MIEMDIISMNLLCNCVIMNTITTEVPFAVKEKHMDINTLVKKYLNFLQKEQSKSDNIIEINF